MAVYTRTYVYDWGRNEESLCCNQNFYLVDGVHLVHSGVPGGTWSMLYPATTILTRPTPLGLRPTVCPRPIASGAGPSSLGGVEALSGSSMSDASFQLVNLFVSWRVRRRWRL